VSTRVARWLLPLVLLPVSVSLRATGAPDGLVPRFVREPNPIALTGAARPERYMEASGRRAALLGREDGSFEAWAYPLKVLHDFRLSFGTKAYADSIPASSLATTVDVRPESATVRYAHSVFTVDATWLVPVNEPGALILLDVQTSEPITVTVKFRVDLKPMWPAGLGGQYSYWDTSLKAYVLGEGSRKNAALVGSPLGLEPPEQPAHNLPDAPTQFSIAITPEMAASGLVPIVIAASVEKLDGAKLTYERLLASAEAMYRESAAHYRTLRENLTSIESPDTRLNLAFEWGKVALDKGLVCNPHLGCGLIAGLGPSGTSERPGFGWFFGGDAFINAWAMTGYGDFETVKTSLEFLRARQRADGKMMHELSQGAGYIRWFEDYPYGYYHADTTPLYIIAVRDYVRASGDEAFAKDMWPSMKKAYDYCASTDEDGDSLMDNTKAGLAAVETGTLRSGDVRTDVFLAAVWTEAAEAAAELAAIAGDSLAESARATAARARAAINKRFLDDEGRRIYFAVMKDGKGQAEPTVWPAYGLWRGVFDRNRPAVAGALDDLAGAGLGSDWGARMLSIYSALYEPQSYNNGAVWPFLTGFAALGLYSHGRSDAAWAYLDATADLTFLESRGYIAELFSGDRLRSVDAAVPHQLFATTGFMSTLIRGLAGLNARPAGFRDGRATPARLRLAPQLPSGWPFLKIRNVRWHGVTADIAIVRDETGASMTVAPTGGTLPLEIEMTLPPGAALTTPDPAWRAEDAQATGGRGLRFSRFEKVAAPATYRLPYRNGIEVTLVQKPLALGDVSSRLRIIDARVDKGIYTLRVEGRRGRTYAFRLTGPRSLGGVQGARVVRSLGTTHELEVTMPRPAVEAPSAVSRRSDWATADVTVSPNVPKR
jgi:glycogen debranching enzyme